jgi:hypothetical protein
MLYSNSIDIAIPTPTKPITPIQINVLNGNENVSDRTIKFSKRYPPNYIPLEDRLKNRLNVEERIGDINGGRVAVSLVGQFLTANRVQNRLREGGFNILSVTPLDNSKDKVSIVFTDDILRGLASKPKRGFASNLRVVVDRSGDRVLFINPMYILKALLQDDFDIKKAREILSKILDIFPNLQNSDTKYKFQSLFDFQFMKGMPRYIDMVEVAKGKDLIKKVEENKNIEFIDRLNNNSIIIGIKPSKNISSFINKIGKKHTGLFPYQILIEDNIAYILDPRYYIALIYPDLKMEEFMKIAKVPEKIISECRGVFK